MRSLRLVAGTAAILTFVLIVLGALVRATNSGLSCPDWPTCYGDWVPLPTHSDLYLEHGYSYTQVMLEWLHRLIAGVFVGPLALVMAFLAWRLRASGKGLATAGLVLLVLLLIQGLLGGLTVLDRNSPWSVALHLGNALLVFSAILFMLVRTDASVDRGMAVDQGRGIDPGVRSDPLVVFRTLAVTAWVLAVAAMVSAAMTAKSGASLACGTWPLCNGAVIPDLSEPLIVIHFAHRVLAALFALTLVALFVTALRNPALAAHETRLAGLAAAMVVFQIVLGASVIILKVPIFNAVLHQGWGVLTFAVLTCLMWRAMTVPGMILAPARRTHGEVYGSRLQGT